MDLIEYLKLSIARAEEKVIAPEQFGVILEELEARVKNETAGLRASGQRNFVALVDNLLATFKSFAPKFEEIVDEVPKVYNNNKKATR